jgi:ABC-type nitrate/sulfonate/bicarbonate transport system permease component
MKTYDITAEILSTSKRRPKWLSVVPIFTIVALWVLAAKLRLVSSLILPDPMRIILAVHDIGFTLAYHFAATAIRTAVSLVMGSLLGIILGLGAQYNSVVFVVLNPIIQSARPVPAVALIPFFLLIFGFSEIGKILLATLAVMFVVVIGTIDGVERVDLNLARFGLSLGLEKRTLFLRILVPAMLPSLESHLRVALAMGITVVVAAEFMGAEYGLGYLINVARLNLATPTIFLCICALGLLGGSYDLLIRKTFDRICPWDRRIA